MLDSLRNAASTWIAKLLLGLLVLSFAVWGISGQMFTGGGGDVITVGNTSVSVLDYRLAYDRRVAELSQQLGTRLTRAQAEAFGVDNQVLSQLTAGALLDETSRKMGLGLSQEKVAALTAADPAFSGADGRFNRQQFEFVLNQAGMRPEQYLRNREQAAIRQQIVDAVAGDVSVPETLLTNVALYRGESRTMEYVPLPRSLVEPIEPPGEETLANWFEERQSDYAAPEYRKINYVKLEPEDIIDPSVISDEQVRRSYEENRERYTTAERRTIEQIAFASEEDAAAALESIRTGATFEDLVAMQNKSMEDVNLGTLTRDGIADEAVAEAAFSLPEGKVSDVVEGAFGPVILRVTEITAEEATPLAEVSEEIRQELALSEASHLVLDTYEAYEDARAAGQTMQEAAESQQLAMQTVEAVDSSGRRPDGSLVQDLPASRQLLGQAFETEEGLENRPINLGTNGYLFYEVEEVIPARDRTLDEVRDEVVEDWTDAEAARRLSEMAARFQKDLEGGKTLDEIAAEIGQQKAVKRGLKREADDADLGRAGVAAAFGVPKGGTGAFPNPAGDGQFLFQVTEVFEPASASPEMVPEEVAGSMRRAISNDLLDQLIAQLETEHEISVNRGAMQQALSF
ncbi:SurA N-terminal domain-containing protein [Chelativorans sp. M5D2P16]|uniref:SurA N-terminal domain-containing protein n=1 Tax=Chelativorans sp. M5D2P16 TaxID=3095678 RepID=UPI002ACA43F0|nr:SurA N-terminal domain-containing protein [Chelativorans sp. M5D2P16]MDZ5697749.1 SurA N-terminal domain-containing protein [Chelativorans sp. M5D2P16]